jgi:hypothetical protein
LFGRFGPLHLPLWSSRRPMRVLGPMFRYRAANGYVATTTSREFMPKIGNCTLPPAVPGGCRVGSLGAEQHGTALSSVAAARPPQCRQDHAHVGPWGGKRVPAPALARHRRQVCLSQLRLYDLLRLPAIGQSTAMALQGVSARFLDHLGRPVVVLSKPPSSASHNHTKSRTRSPCCPFDQQSV